MAGGKIKHWKHGWIPVTPEAKAFVAGNGPNPTAGEWKSGPKGTMMEHTRVRVGGQGNVKPISVFTALQNAMDEGGFTFNPRKGNLLQVGKIKGVAVAKPGTETVIGNGDISRADFIQKVANVIEKHGDAFANGSMLGGWYSPDRDIYMVEVTDLFPDRESAIIAGKERNQEGVFDLGTGDYIDTGGTGDG
jgi:hypothetical protein